MWFLTLKENGSSLDTGLNFLLYVCHISLIQSADINIERYLKESLYNRAIQEAIALYDVNEAHCRDVVSDERILSSILTMVNANLNFNNINAAESRRIKGNVLFEELLSRERLHKQLISSPIMTDSLLQWLKSQ
jgi:hypothetical protein